ncbi:MAG: T9SS type A sorting domain-containing protein [Bacteroidales bacterium]|nr:T9SS type A sorting domain-containing protein [Bacteroidales bacterium]
MKKLKFLFINILMLLAFSAATQPYAQLYWRFANPVVIPGTPYIFQFDVEISCDMPGTYHSDMQIYFDYNNLAFGPSIVSNGNIQHIRLDLMDGELFPGMYLYDIYGPADITDHTYAILSEASFPPTAPTWTFEYMTEVPQYPVFGGFFQFRIKITDNTQLAGIEFRPDLMNGGNYFRWPASGQPYNAIKYGTPPDYAGIYVNNLLDFWLTISGTIAGTITDIDTGTPIEGAIITAGQYSDTTASNGTYSMILPVSIYDITADAECYYPMTQFVVIIANDTITVNFELTPLPPPTNVQANVNGNDVIITWTAPCKESYTSSAFAEKNCKDLIGYNIYRNGDFIEFVIDTSIQYLGLSPGIYTYCVTAVYDEGESFEICADTVTIDNLLPPSNLQYYFYGYNVQLFWEEPITPGDWIHWDNGENYTSVGLTNGGTFLVASRWDQTNLAPYNGQYLTKVCIFPNDPATTYTLKVWTGANASTLVLDQSITGLTFEAWNEIVLDSPVQIDASTELWFGYEVLNHPAGTYPAGVDPGPAVAGFGDMISTDGTSWDPLSGFGLDYNWNLQGFVQESTDGKTPAKPLVNILKAYENTGTLVQSPINTLPDKSVFNTNDLLGYNVYRDAQIIGFTTNLYYDDVVPCFGFYEYCITAVYNGGESDSVCVNIWVITGIEELNNITTVIYPNPTTELVNIESTMKMEEVKVFNSIGKIVFENNEVNNKFFSINLISYKQGVYYIQILNKKGLINHRLIIK